jgi:hypothetical protein
MSEKEAPGPGPATDEHEFYAEPATLNGRDAAGVVAALVALLLIGVGGYVWLTPGMSLAKLLGRGSAVQRPPVEAAGTASSGDTAAVAPAQTPASGPATLAQPGSTAADALLAAANGEREAHCPRCGMFAGKSHAEVVAQWSDGSIAHHDSFDCVFGWAKDQGLTLQRALVLEHGSTPAAPRWLEAATATYVYDTKSIKGSMPPFTAAFAATEAAQSAAAAEGGQVVDWEGLQAKFK